MVAIRDGHDHDDGEVCPGCVRAVQAVIHFDIGDGDEEFDDGFGDLIDDMHAALAALHRAYRERLTTRHDYISSSYEAATKLVCIKNAIVRLIARGCDLEQ